jgi:hypothetical protein
MGWPFGGGARDSVRRDLDREYGENIGGEDGLTQGLVGGRRAGGAESSNDDEEEEEDDEKVPWGACVHDLTLHASLYTAVCRYKRIPTRTRVEGAPRIPRLLVPKDEGTPSQFLLFPTPPQLVPTVHSSLQACWRPPRCH